VAAKIANMKHGTNQYKKVDTPMGVSTVSQQQAARTDLAPIAV
jgi:hypothetical protein